MKDLQACIASVVEGFNVVFVGVVVDDVVAKAVQEYPLYIVQ